MITVFTDPYPEELLYSSVARYQERIMASHRATLLELFGKAEILVAVNLPSRLGTLVSNLFPGNAYSSEGLIKEHTLLPYFAPFLEGNQLISVMDAMIGEGGLAVVANSGIAASTVREPATLRFCPQCVKSDRAQYGEAFWHRVHQLPGIVFCPHHSGTAIFNSSVRTHDASCHGLVTLEAVLGDTGYTFEETVGHFSPLHEFIAKESLWLLTNWTPSVGLTTIRERYIAALQQRDLASLSGRVRARKLIGGIIDAFGHNLLQHWGCDLLAGSKKSWPLRIINQSYRSQHPLKHLLLLYFLDMDVETLLRSDVRRVKTKPWPCLNPVADHYRMPVILAPRKIYRGADGRDSGVFACDCGFSYRCPLDADPFTGARIITHGAVWEKRLRELSQTPGVRLSSAARMLKVDPGTITRHATRLNLSRWAKSGDTKELPKPAKDSRAVYRSAWLQHQEDKPGASRTELQRTLWNIYLWLYDHDREWLMAHQPKCSRSL